MGLPDKPKTTGKPGTSSRIPSRSVLFNWVIPISLVLLGIIMLGLILVALGVLVGLVHF